MSSIGGLTGIGSSPGAQGLGFNATGAQLVQPTTAAQANTAYTQSQTGIQNQADFLSALQAQNGIANQSQVYNQLQGVANGTGPNPAAAQLAQATGANTANQAALMAGQRGAGSNVGLIARQAAQQGAANQQNAAGQAATMQANQSLNALGQLSGVAGQQVGQQAAATGAYTGATQGEQGLLLNAIQGQNTAMVQNQDSLNKTNGAMAQAGGAAQGQLIGGVLNGAGAALGLAKGGRVNAANGFPAAGAFNTENDTTSSGLYQPGDTGQTSQPAFGNVTTPDSPAQPTQPKAPSAGPKSSLGKMLSGAGGAYQSGQQSGASQAGNVVGSAIGKGLGSMFGSSGPTDAQTATGNAQLNAASEGEVDLNMYGGNNSTAAYKGGMFASGGKVPAMVSPGERYLNPREVEKVAKGKDPLKAGEKIPGKAKVKGDSLKNDTVSKTLEEGGIVLPKSVMEAKHPHWEAHKFVSAILAKKQGLRGTK